MSPNCPPQLLRDAPQSNGFFRLGVTLAACCLLMTSSGCISFNMDTVRKAAYLSQLSSGGALKVRKTPRNPLEDQLNLFSRKGPEPSDRTLQILRLYGLEEKFESEPLEAFEQLREAVNRAPEAEHVYAVAETAYVLGVRESKANRDEQALQLFGESLAVSYEYLFDERLATGRNPYDPEFRGACDLYNGSLESMLRLMAEGGFLHPGYNGSIELMGRRMDVAFDISGRWEAEDIEGFEFTSDYEVTGLNNQHRSYGLGVPLIAVRRSATESVEPEEKYYPNGLTFPVTAFFRLLPSRSVSEGSATNLLCAIEFHDPLQQTEIEVAGKTTPLETDISTPLAYYLNDPIVGTSAVATFALLNADFAEGFEGLHMLEPYDPDKIPVVMVHGLWSSPKTWMEMFNDLRALEDIRDNYQFWFYMYPTGQPFWISAEQMRVDLADARRNLDPKQESTKIDQMILIGHSMGGLVSRLQTIDSGDRFWSLVSDRPFEELEGDEKNRAELQQVLYFAPDSSVKRIVTIGTPHRGSNFANNTTRWLSRRFFSLPSMLQREQVEVVRDNPEFFNNTDLLTINTSIDSLSPQSPFLEAMLEARRAPWVKHHNIVGLAEDKSFDLWIGEKVTGEGDGVVPVDSAEFDRADSQIVVPAKHQQIHQHPVAILEVRRILMEHLEETERGIRHDGSVRRADFANPNQANGETNRGSAIESQSNSGTIQGEITELPRGVQSSLSSGPAGSSNLPQDPSTVPQTLPPQSSSTARRFSLSDDSNSSLASPPAQADPEGGPIRTPETPSDTGEAQDPSEVPPPASASTEANSDAVAEQPAASDTGDVETNTEPEAQTVQESASESAANTEQPQESDAASTLDSTAGEEASQDNEPASDESSAEASTTQQEEASASDAKPVENGDPVAK